jgi:hypothetical protein
MKASSDRIRSLNLSRAYTAPDGLKCFFFLRMSLCSYLSLPQGLLAGSIV